LRRQRRSPCAARMRPLARPMAARATVLLAVVAQLPSQICAQSSTGTFKLPPLPYEYDALEPHFDEQTMRIHHGKHHATYVGGLNVIIEQFYPEASVADALALANIQKKVMAKGEAARNNGGGAYNHALFWVNLQPSSAPLSEPSSELAAAIDDKFGSFDEFKAAFSKAAMTRFGSGWAWLGVKPDGSLAVTSTANQDNPLMVGLPYDHTEMVPILGLDVWEHAYYLKYQNKRVDYVAAFWNLVNWNKVSRNFEMYAKEGKPVPPTTTGGNHATEL